MRPRIEIPYDRKEVMISGKQYTVWGFFDKNLLEWGVS
jgi:hypothetical protein